MIKIVVRTITTVAALLFEPVPTHAKTARPTKLVGEAPSGTAETGERGDRTTSTPAGTPSSAVDIPAAEQAPGWVAHPAFRIELSDEHLAYRLAVWSQEVSR